MTPETWPEPPFDGPNQFRRIRWITYALVLMVVASTLTLGFFQMRRDYETIMAAEERSAGNIVRSMEAHLLQVVSESRRILEGVSALYVDRVEQDRFDEAFFHAQLELAIERSGNLATLFLLDENSFPIAGSSSYPLPESTRQTKFEMSQTAARGVIDFELGPLEQTTLAGNPDVIGSWFLPMVSVARSADGDVIGMVVGVIDPDVFNGFYGALEVGENGVIQLWSEDGLLIAANQNSTWRTGDRLESAAQRMADSYADVGSELDGVLEFAIDPATEALYVGTQSQVLGFRFTAVVNRSPSDYLTPWFESRRRILVGEAIFISVLGILMTLLLRQLKLTESSQRQTQQAREEAENANDARRQFLAQVSHEFRTPLNAIIGFSDMIKESVYGPNIDTKYIDSARHIQLSGNHLLKIVNDIIDITKIDAGEYVLDRTLFPVRVCAESAVVMLSDTAAHKNVSIDIGLSEDLPLLNADKRLTTQILLNLLSNAVRYAPEASAVRISGQSLSDGTLEISVTDLGPGIDPDIKDKIGQPFVIGSTHVYTKEQGTGLGLSICKKLMDVMGGALLIESEPNRGTTARVLFPAQSVSS